jgi:hypothetical protein
MLNGGQFHDVTGHESVDGGDPNTHLHFRFVVGARVVFVQHPLPSGSVLHLDLKRTIAPGTGRHVANGKDVHVFVQLPRHTRESPRTGRPASGRGAPTLSGTVTPALTASASRS